MGLKSPIGRIALPDLYYAPRWAVFKPIQVHAISLFPVLFERINLSQRPFPRFNPHSARTYYILSSMVLQCPFFLLVMGPHSYNLHGLDVFQDLVYEAVLNVDTARISSGQIANWLFIRRGGLEGILGEDIQ